MFNLIQVKPGWAVIERHGIGYEPNDPCADGIMFHIGTIKDHRLEILPNQELFDKFCHMDEIDFVWDRDHLYMFARHSDIVQDVIDEVATW